MHTVIKAAGVPHPVVASASPVEVASVCAVKHVDAVVGVLAGVAVHNIHENQQAQPVSLVDQRLQLIWASKSAACLRTGMSISFLRDPYHPLVLEAGVSVLQEGLGRMSGAFRMSAS